MKQDIEAIIFDFDGTLVNSVEIYLDFFLKLGQRFGNNGGVTKDDFMRLNGKSITDALKLLVKEKKYKRRIIPYLLFRRKKLEQEVRAQTTLYKEALDCLIHLQKHYKLAIASNSKIKHVGDLCKEHNLASFFEFIFTQEDVTNRKPDPEIFLKAAKALNTPLNKCLIIEDSPTGVKAASAAEMPVFVVEYTTPREYFIPKPDAFIKDLSVLNKSFIEEHFSDKKKESL